MACMLVKTVAAWSYLADTLLDQASPTVNQSALLFVMKMRFSGERR